MRAVKRFLIGSLSILALSQGLSAQSNSAETEPAELPPAGYEDVQYVDSRGCVFVRVGHGNSVSWVPRMSSARQMVCGHSPSIETATASEPQPSGAVQTRPASQPRAISSRRAPPIQVENSGFVVPDGYRLAWSDDRLNPRRGQGTAEGEAMMLRLWTNTVPRELVPDADVNPTPVVVSTRSAAITATHRFIQVATFEHAANARRVAQQFRRMGLPARIGKTTRGTQVVLVGPFETQADLTSAMREVQRAGHPNAVFRR